MATGQDAVTKPGGGVLRARLFLLLAGCIWGTYAVLLRAINTVQATPLPAVFVTAARYQFLCGFAFIQRGFFARHRGTGSAASATEPEASGEHGVADPTWAAIELAAIAVFSTLASIWGVALVPSVTSEILSSTVHVFVPLLTVLSSGSLRSDDFGARTWAGCIVSFMAAVGETVASAAADGEGVPKASFKGQAAVVGSALVLALQRVRAQHHLKTHSASILNNRRMQWMGYISLIVLVADAMCGGASAATLSSLGSIHSMQWALMALSVFLSAFVAASLQYEAQSVVPAANAQPFLALQPIFSAFWAFLLLREPVALSSLLGGCAQIGGAIIASTDPSIGEKNKKKDE